MTLHPSSWVEESAHNLKQKWRYQILRKKDTGEIRKKTKLKMNDNSHNDKNEREREKISSIR